MLKLHGMRPPIRQVLALDAGSRCIKLLLAEAEFGRLRILKEELIDLQTEGLVAADEIKAHLQASLEAWDRPPLALVLPQHLSNSQVIDLPLVPDSEVEKLIEGETLKLSGVSESRIVYDFVRTETPAKSRQQFWVTFAQEGEIRERILRLGLEQEDLCEVTTTANALIAAYRATCPLSSRAVLVHGRANHRGGHFARRPGGIRHQFPDGRRFFHALPGAVAQLSGREGGNPEMHDQPAERTGGLRRICRAGGRLGGRTEAAIERMVRTESRHGARRRLV
jgi:hypothetical protein